MWHHIIPKHEWRKRFNTLDGVNSSDNLVNLTCEQHALAHKFLYELNGYEVDRIAYEGLMKFISHEEAVRKVQSLPKTEIHKARISEKLKNKKNALGVKRTKSQNERRKSFMKENKNSVGRFWVTNSEGKNKCLRRGESVPDGWLRGRSVSWLNRNGVM